MLFYLTLLLLVVSAINLALMIPGGSVELREFDNYPTWVLALFNIFLTVLGLGSLVLAWRLYQGGTGLVLAAVAGLAYVAVYVADLARIFPVAETPMPSMLTRLEQLGTILGAALAIIAGWAALSGVEPPAVHAGGTSPWVVAALAVLAIAIVIFATRKALSRS